MLKRLNNPDSDNDAELEYTEHVIAFIDLIGFKNMLDDSENHPKKLGEILSVLRDIKSLEEDLFIKATAFSDSVILSVPILEDVGNKISNLVTTLVVLQNRLLRANIILRGAVTIGKLYHEEGVVFGPALIEAYKLESNNAIFPRIIVQDSLHNYPSSKVCSDDGLDAKVGSLSFIQAAYPWRTHLCHDNDGLLFIDYLHSASRISVGGKGVLGWDIVYSGKMRLYFEQVGQFIQENIIRNEDNIRYIQKWRWLG